MATETDQKANPASSSPPSKSSSKSSGVPKNHEEAMERQNAAIEAEMEKELEQQKSSQEEMEAIANDTNDRANFNVITVARGESSPPARFGTLTAVEVYGAKGMARYDVAEGDNYIKIVLVNSADPEPEGPEAKK